MEFTMETPLDVLSRAASMLHHEEKEACLKRNIDREGKCEVLNKTEADDQTTPHHKRPKISCPQSTRRSHDHKTTDENSKKCIATQTPFSSFTPSGDRSSPVSAEANQSGQTPREETEKLEEVKKASSTLPPPPPYVESSHSHLHWQSIMAAMPHSSSFPPLYSLPSAIISPQLTPNTALLLPATKTASNQITDQMLRIKSNHKNDSNCTIDRPLNLSMSSSVSSSSAQHHDIKIEQKSTNTGNSVCHTPDRTNSPTVPESTSQLLYPSTATNLSGLEARTTRRQIEPDICDQSIEEHFRRSLGTAYSEVLKKSSSSSENETHMRTPSPQHTEHNKLNVVSVSGTVDDHFAKALGHKTWNELRVTHKSEDSSEESVNEHFAKALGATWHKIQAQRKDIVPITNNTST